MDAPDDSPNRLYAAMRHVSPARRRVLMEICILNEINASLTKAIADSGLSHDAIENAAGVAPGIIGPFMSGSRALQLQAASKIAASLGLRLVAATQSQT